MIIPCAQTHHAALRVPTHPLPPVVVVCQDYEWARTLWNSSWRRGEDALRRLAWAAVATCNWNLGGKSLDENPVMFSPLFAAICDNLEFGHSRSSRLHRVWLTPVWAAAGLHSRVEFLPSKLIERRFISSHLWPVDRHTRRLVFWLVKIGGVNSAQYGTFKLAGTTANVIGLFSQIFYVQALGANLIWALAAEHGQIDSARMWNLANSLLTGADSAPLSPLTVMKLHRVARRLMSCVLDVACAAFFFFPVWRPCECRTLALKFSPQQPISSGGGASFSFAFFPTCSSLLLGQWRLCRVKMHWHDL